MNQGLLALAIVGAVSTLKHSIKSDVISGWVTVAIAISLGLLAGFGGVEGLTPITGILTGLTSIGGMSVVDRVVQNIKE